LLQRARDLASCLAHDRLVRNNSIYFAGTFVAGVGGYAYHFLTARFLGPAAYGAVASAIAALYLLTLPAPVMQTVAMRFASLAAARNDSGRIRQLLVRVSVVNLAVGAVIAALLLLLGPAAARYLQIADPRIAYVLAPATMAALLVAGNRGVIQGMQRFVALSVNVLLDSVTRVVVAVAAIAAGAGALGAVTAVVVGPALAYAQSFVLLSNPNRAAADNSLSFGDLGKYAASAAVGVMGVTFLFNADVILAKHYLSPASAGIYAAGSVLARVVYFLGLTVAGVMFPAVATLHARDEAHFHVVDVSLLFMGGVTVAFVAVYGLVPGLVLIPFGSSFAPVRPLLGLFALALSLLAIANLLVNYFLSLNSLRFVPPLVGACILEVVLITLFHRDPGQVLTMVVITMAALAAAMGGLYAGDRLFSGRTTAGQSPKGG
jgi:O-antigen/teichoic acid export membrane protein